MNIIEAIKSGKRFKRPDWPEWCSEADIRDPEDGHLDITRADTLANDWEVEEAVVPITASRFDSAWDRAIYGTNLHYGIVISSFTQEYVDRVYRQLIAELKLQETDNE